MAETSKQSRKGKQPVSVPKGVTVKFDASSFTVKGPKGEITSRLPEAVALELKDDKVVVSPIPGSGKTGLKFQGLARALVDNAVQGCHEGYKTSLDLYGVGYRAEVKGKELHLALGLSHPVLYTLPDVVSAKVETIDQAGVKRPRLHLESHDKTMLGQVASRIKSFRPPEPYKGKGVRFTGERIREKAGKTGAK